MNRSDYAYSVAYVRAIESKLLTPSDIESLIGAKTTADALRILSDKGYGADISDRNFEAALTRAYRKCFDEISEIAPKDAPLDVLLYKNDFHNLKVVLKGVRLGVRDYENYIITPATCDWESLITGAVNGDFDNFPIMLKDTAAKAYDILGRTGDSQLCDTLVDRASMDYALNEAVRSKNEFMIGLTTLTNTLTDIKIAARCALTGKDRDFADMAISSKPDLSRDELIKSAASGLGALCEYLSGAGYGDAASALGISVADYEKYADNTINDYMKNAKYITMGIEPLISYIRSKENEIQSVRIIISAKQNGIDEEKIRKRLRKVI